MLSARAAGGTAGDTQESEHGPSPSQELALDRKMAFRAWQILTPVLGSYEVTGEVWRIPKSFTSAWIFFLLRERMLLAFFLWEVGLGPRIRAFKTGLTWVHL